MRQRTTFFHKQENAIDKNSLKVRGHAISGPDLDAVREDRITFGLEELPQDLQELLRITHELHVRWVNPSTTESLGPYNSKLPPGLHIFYTPQDEKEDSAALCDFLREVFGDINCSSPKASFTRLPNDRFSHSTAYQYYQPLEDLSRLKSYASDRLCKETDNKCREQFKRLEQAASLDFSYDTISHAAKVTTLSKHERHSLSIEAHQDHRIEVGLLTEDTPPYMESHELGATGLLTILGQDTKPNPVLFTFPARHKSTKTGFSSSFLFPTGMHPTMQLRISASSPPEEDSFCALHAYLTLPRTIFMDKYQVDDALFLASKNLTALRYMSQPVDLEAPDYVMDSWGSSILLELKPPSGETKQPWTAEIPLHLRYLAPAAGGYADVEVPYPAVFWACTTEEGTKFPTNPFERVNLGYDGLFGPRTLFHHVDPQPEAGDRLFNKIRVPVLDTDKTQWVQTGTAAVVLAGFAWVVWKLLAVYMKSGVKGPATTQSEKKKQ